MKKSSKLWLPVLLTACSGGLVGVEPVMARDAQVEAGAVGKVMRVVLDSGDVVVGTVTGVSDEFFTMESGVFGVVRVQRSRVLTAVEVLPESTAAQLNDPVVEAVEKAAVVPEPEPAVKWENRLEAGLAGSEGNSQSLNISARLSFKRTTARDEVLLDNSYRYEESNNTDIANRFDSLLRYDWRFADNSPWSLFGQAQYEYDQFQDWDSRVSLFGGVGYRVIENETTSLRLRAGLGTSREFGGGTEEWTFEGLLGADFAHEISENQRIRLYTTVFPSLEDAGDFRSASGAAYEIDLNNDGNLALSLGAEHRYDTQPGDAKRSDLDYFARLVFKF